MPACAICTTAITADNDSREHLIPNSIGGRLKVPRFICEVCNNTAGSIWDRELARELNWMSLQFGISRERGSSPPEHVVTTGGEQYVYHPDGSLKLSKPIFKKTPIGAGLEISITARDDREARKMLKKLKEKYPQFNVDATMAKVTPQTKYLKDLLHIGLQFGNSLSGRSMVKSALALAVRSGIEAEKCEVACNYLNNSTAIGRWALYYESDLIVGRPEGVPLHCVAIGGSKGKLVGYVEYFGYRRSWILLSEHYSGPDMHAAYFLDPVSGRELALNTKAIPLELGGMTIGDRNAVVIQAINRVLGPVTKAAQAQEMERAIRNAWEKACSKLKIKEGDPLTRQFSIEITKELRPYIEHLVHNPFKDFKPESGSKAEPPP